MSSQTLPVYLVTLMVQSSCKFYHSLICRLFEYASLYLFSLWESKPGEHGGYFGSTGFAGILAGAFISPGLEPAWFFDVLSLLVPCLRQGGVWITSHVPEADFCLPWAWGAVYCCWLGLLRLAWGLVCLFMEVWLLSAGLQHPSAASAARDMAQPHHDGC